MTVKTQYTGQFFPENDSEFVMKGPSDHPTVFPPLKRYFQHMLKDFTICSLFFCFFHGIYRDLYIYLGKNIKNNEKT